MYEQDVKHPIEPHSAEELEPARGAQAEGSASSLVGTARPSFTERLAQAVKVSGLGRPLMSPLFSHWGE